MKCMACGYSDTETYNETGREENIGNGDEKFIKIYGHFEIDGSGGYYPEKNKVNLFACPKCKTVIMDEF